MISYFKGDVTNPKGSGPRIVAHICNDRGGYGKGVALAVANRWPDAKTYYKRWYASDDFKLGRTQVVLVGEDFWVANMVAQKGYKTASNPQPLCYESLKGCLVELAAEADTRQATICMPRIGTGLAGGDWAVIEPLIRETLGNQDVYVYDL